MEQGVYGGCLLCPFILSWLDLINQEARLPEDKLQKCRLLLESFCKRRKVTLWELQSLIGLLNFTCSVIVPGRAFLRRLIDLTIGGRRPHHHIRLTKETKHDMEVRMAKISQGI